MATSPAAARRSRLTQDACDVIEDFLSYDPLSRLGELTGGEADVQQHPFFVTCTNWTRLLSRQSEPPWLPQLSSGADTSNFEQTTVSRFHQTNTSSWASTPRLSCPRLLHRPLDSLLLYFPSAHLQIPADFLSEPPYDFPSTEWDADF